MNEKVYQKIFDEIGQYLVDGWSKLVVYLEYGAGSYSFAFYEKIEGKYIKCFDLEDVSEKSLLKTFQDIDKVVCKERAKAKEEWTNMTMTVTDKGDMHVDYDYTDFSQGNYKYQKAWKEKYLK
ncbi:immunity protein YezG family protein [Oribacterium sp. P6A1]|uniref:immunity protein YezG family protein n=1 Tax=Oribacterium sp. P6A1 TaxID=1410612 RepID=UPI00055DE916|nr:immunity protein YezG family protein [Oribacterium sp. P6A1]